MITFEPVVWQWEDYRITKDGEHYVVMNDNKLLGSFKILGDSIEFCVQHKINEKEYELEELKQFQQAVMTEYRKDGTVKLHGIK